MILPPLVFPGESMKIVYETMTQSQGSEIEQYLHLRSVVAKTQAAVTVACLQGDQIGQNFAILQFFMALGDFFLEKIAH